MAIPPQFRNKAEGGDMPPDGYAPLLKEIPDKKNSSKKKKKYSKEQQDAIQRRLKGGKGSGRN